jgi:hypothetical protein
MQTFRESKHLADFGAREKLTTSAREKLTTSAREKLTTKEAV